MYKTKINRIMALLLALVMALAAITSALAADAEDYTTVTGTWEYDEHAPTGMVTFTNCNDPSNPSVVVVPSVGSGTFKTRAVFIYGDAIKNPNMTVISLPKEFRGTWDNVIYNCTKIVYRGTKDDWSKKSHSFGDTDMLPRKIPVVTLDGEVIDTIGPSWWPADSGPLATKEYLAMTALMEQYPNGSYWPLNTTYIWNAGVWYGDALTAFNHSDKTSVMVYVPEASQRFAMMVSDAAFGDLPAKKIDYKQWSDIWVGDILQLDGHGVIILEVYDDYVIVAERPSWGEYVQWGRKISKDRVEKDIEYVVTRWPDRTGAQQPEKPAISFTDVPANAWYAKAVDWAVAKGITKGTSATTFSPAKTCSNVEVITFLHRANGSPKADATLPFTVKNGWATDSLKWAFSKGIIDADFDENAACTRYMAVDYIWKARNSPYSYTGKFNDISGLDTRPVYWAVQNGITNGTSATTFSPDLICDRATIVTLLHRAYQ